MKKFSDYLQEGSSSSIYYKRLNKVVGELEELIYEISHDRQANKQVAGLLDKALNSLHTARDKSK